MNYYERYCGDYQRDTADLSLIEQGAYTQLLDTYYATEMPLPAESARLYRICRAILADEQAAVDEVVERFFPLGPDGRRHNNRADDVIAAYQAKSNASRANGIKGGRPPGKPNGKPKGKPKVEPGNNLAGNPDPNPDESPPAPAPTPESVLADGTRAQVAEKPKGTPAGEACVLMREAGIQAVNPSDAELLRLLAVGVTPQQVGDLAVELRDSTGTPPNARYVIRAMAGRLRDAAQQGERAGPKGDPALAPFNGWRRDDQKALALSRHLNMGDGRPGESFDQLKARIDARLAERRRTQEAAA